MEEQLRNTSDGSNPRVRLLSQRGEASPTSTDSSPAFLQQMVATMTAIGMLLAARVLLLLSGIGAFALHYLAVGDPRLMPLLVAGVYDTLVFLPLVALYLRRG